MKAAVFHGPRDIRLEDVPEPSLRPARSRSRSTGAGSAAPTCTSTSRARSSSRRSARRTRSRARRCRSRWGTSSRGRWSRWRRTWPTRRRRQRRDRARLPVRRVSACGDDLLHARRLRGHDRDDAEDGCDVTDGMIHRAAITARRRSARRVRPSWSRTRTADRLRRSWCAAAALGLGAPQAASRRVAGVVALRAARGRRRTSPSALPGWRDR